MNIPNHGIREQDQSDREFTNEHLARASALARMPEKDRETPITIPSADYARLVGLAHVGFLAKATMPE